LSGKQQQQKNQQTNEKLKSQTITFSFPLALFKFTLSPLKFHLSISFRDHSGIQKKLPSLADKFSGQYN